jgi:hypothetical protein
MNHLQDADSERFVDELRALLTSSEIRFHIKDTALAVLGGLSDPTSAEAEMLLDVAAGHPPYEQNSGVASASQLGLHDWTPTAISRSGSKMVRRNRTARSTS